MAPKLDCEQSVWSTKLILTVELLLHIALSKHLKLSCLLLAYFRKATGDLEIYKSIILFSDCDIAVIWHYVTVLTDIHTETLFLF